MINLKDLQTIIADNFSNGDLQIAGLMMMMCVMLLIAAFTIRKGLTLTLLMMMPVTLIFSAMGVLTGDMMILMIIVSVLGLGISARKIMS